MCVVLFSAYRSFPSEIRGLGQWSLGLFLLVCGACLYGVRDLLPDGVAVMGVSATLLWGIGLAMIGTERFYGRRPSWRTFHLVWLGGMAGMAWCLVVRPDFAARVAIISFFVLVFYLRQLRLIASRGERHFSTYFFGTLMALQTLIVFTRGCMALSRTIDHVDLVMVGGFPALYLASGNFMALMLTVAFMTVTTRRLQTILEQRSTLDPLTSVLNRRGFGDLYVKERAQLRRDAGMMTLLSIDLDFFKSINDRYGHAMGDRVLIHIAGVIGKVLRESDHVARFGGEEFVVLLPATGIEAARAIAERIQSTLRAPRNDALPVYTVSIGVACQLSADEDLDGILMRADAALYRAKENGRDRIEIAEPAPAAPQVRRA